MKCFKLIFILTTLIGAASCDRKSASELFDEAYLLEEQQKYAEAIILLDQAIEKNPKYVEAYINRGADKSALGRHSDAIIDYNKALRFDPVNVLAIFNIGNNYLRLDSFNTAVKYFTKALKLKNTEGRIILDLTPNEITGTGYSDVPAEEIFYLRAYAYMGLLQYENAIQDFQKCIGLNFEVSDSRNQVFNCMNKRKERFENDSSRYPSSEK